VPRIHAHLYVRGKQSGAEQIHIGGMMIGKKELAAILPFSFSQSLDINHDAIDSGVFSPAGEEGLVCIKVKSTRFMAPYDQRYGTRGSSGAIRSSSGASN
jgi:hypothetical protein